MTTSAHRAFQTLVGDEFTERCELGPENPQRRPPNGLAASLKAQHPGAAASLREGLEETLTVQTRGIGGALYRTLGTTNPIENLNGLVAHYTRNVKRFKDGEMVQRWVASALSDAAARMRKLRGCGQMKTLLKALAEKASATDEQSARKAA